MKILVLGGHGFVGKNTVNELNEKHIDIITPIRGENYELLDYNSVIKLFSSGKFDAIINLAAKVGSLNYVTQIAADIFDINMRMLLNIYKAIQETNSKAILINPIANCSYPGNIEFYKEEDFWAGKVHQSVYAYGNTRRMMAVLSTCYRMQYGLKSINLIVPNMYGPFDSTDPNKAHALNALAGKFVRARKTNLKEVEIWGSGIAIREWLFAKDFGRIILEILKDIEAVGYEEPFNIGQNFGLSIRELVSIIVKKTDYKGGVKWNKNMPDGAPRKVMDDTRFRKLFPNYKFTEFEKGLEETINYYESIQHS